MTAKNLKAYTRRLMELEHMLHLQKKLGVEIMKEFRSQMPREPYKQQTHKPVPVAENCPREPLFPAISYILLGLWSAVSLGRFFSGISDGEEWFSALAMFLFTIIAICLRYFFYKNAKVEWNRKVESVMEKYRNECDAYIADKEECERKYKEAIIAYEKEKDIIEKKYKDAHHKNFEIQYSVEKTLNEMYSINVIFPKYRNLVAITMINEYLESGRCTELEGPNGAYSLYEMELRQNIIIEQLTRIADNLESIRETQYLLYKKLSASNQILSGILYEMSELNKTAQLNAHYNYVTALVASSPKIIKGIIY